MPVVNLPNGGTTVVPGVYSTIKVVSTLPGPLPEFQVPLALGQACHGHPYNADSLKYPEEPAFTPFKFCGTSSACESYFGPMADLSIAMRYAKRAGLAGAFLACMSAMTRFDVPVTSTGPIVQFTLYAKKFGLPTQHGRLKCPSGTSIVYTPPKNWTQITTTTASGDRRVYVKDNSWVTVGATIYLGANAIVDASKVVLATGVEVSATGQLLPWIDLTTTCGAAFDAATGLCYNLDSNHKESSPTFTTVQSMMDWVNLNSQWLGAHKETATFTNPAAVIAIASDTVLKEIATWGSVVKGTAPAPTSTDYTNFVTLMDASAWDLFLQTTGLIPRLFGLWDSSSTIHGTMRDWAVSKRTRGEPIAIVSGCAWGDTSTSAGDDTNPIFRAAALDSQDFQLCAGGLDYLGAYLSFAPQVWALRAAGGIPHNLTNDPLNYSSVEVRWDERNSGQLTSLHKGGVCVYRLSAAPPIRYVVSEGLSTLQNNLTSWNVITADTPLVAQRDNGDAVALALKLDLDGNQLGVDEVTPASIAGTLITKGAQLLKKGWINQPLVVTSVDLDDSGAGYDPQVAVSLPTTTDFLVLTMNVQIGA